MSWTRAVVVGCLVVLTACSTDGADVPAADPSVPGATADVDGGNRDSDPGSGSDPELDDDARPPISRQAAIDAAVDVRADGCGPRVGFGTGSVIDDRLVATAAHVVAGADTVELIGTDGTTSGGEVVLFDPDLDIALVRTSTSVGTPLAVRPDDAERGEQGIVVLPRSTDGELVIEVADVTVLRPANVRTTDIYLEAAVERAGFEIEGSIDPGDSGAMVVLPGGGAGIVWARSNVDEQRAWATDLPPTIVAGDTADLTAPVDVGPCIR